MASILLPLAGMAKADRALRRDERLSRIQLDLERRGVAPDHAEPVALHLAEIVGSLSTSEYAALLDGIAAACRPAPVAAGGRPRKADLEELRRLMEGFAGELRKLDEGLRTLSAFLTRMRTRAETPTPGRTLH